MHPEKSSLSIRLTEPVVPLRSTPERASRNHDGGVLPPAIVRGLLTLKLAKPTKVSSIELELQAKATTHYKQGAGPSHMDVTDQYKVHSASTMLFKAGPISQERRRATSTRPGMQFLDDHTKISVQHGARPNGHRQAPSPNMVTRSASLDPLSPRAKRRLSSDELEIDCGMTPRRSQLSIDPAPPYSGPASANHHSFHTAHLNVTDRSQPFASSSRITQPQSSPILSRNDLTPDILHGSPTPSMHSTRRLALSRTSSIEETPEDGSESFDASPIRPDSVAYYGLTRIATNSSSHSSEQDHRGRSHSRFSFGRVVHVFEAMKDRVRSRSPRAVSQPPSEDHEERRGRSLTKGKGKAHVSTHGMRDVLSQFGIAEPSAADGVNDQRGDGWVMFPEGTYTYPVFFTIPNNLPPTMKADHGSLIWRVKAEVKRAGAFMSRMTTETEVIVVCVPTSDDIEEAEGVDLQQQWEEQLQYRVQIGGRTVPVGGKMPFQLTITPSAKVKIHSILVYLDECTEYYAQAQSRVRSDAIRRATLLVIKYNNANERDSKPVLPLSSDEPDAFRKSPLYRFLPPGEDESEAASVFMGPGPWMIRHQLRTPDSCTMLHPSNQAKHSNVKVSHTLKLALRVEKDEGTATSGRKLYDIVVHIPIQILSCRCTSEWVALPCYDEALRSKDNSLEDTSACPCRASRQVKARTHFHRAPEPPSHPLEPAGSSQTANSNSPRVLDIFPSDSLASHTHLHEQLMAGLVSETGEAPPSYERFGVVYA